MLQLSLARTAAPPRPARQIPQAHAYLCYPGANFASRFCHPINRRRTRRMSPLAAKLQDKITATSGNGPSLFSPKLRTHRSREASTSSPPRRGHRPPDPFGLQVCLWPYTAARRTCSVAATISWSKHPGPIEPGHGEPENIPHSDSEGRRLFASVADRPVHQDAPRGAAWPAQGDSPRIFQLERRPGQWQWQCTQVKRPPPRYQIPSCRWPMLSRHTRTASASLRSCILSWTFDLLQSARLKPPGLAFWAEIPGNTRQNRKIISQVGGQA
ncbi:hypothetical protein C8Q79DRAFT_685004 [Trametes meyenii]|nr:hypothetical protein C8Q79DRAFT_685004 [Trametes meyenii]